MRHGLPGRRLGGRLGVGDPDDRERLRALRASNDDLVAVLLPISARPSGESRLMKPFSASNSSGPTMQ